MLLLLLVEVVCCPWLVQHEILLIGDKYTIALVSFSTCSELEMVIML